MGLCLLWMKKTVGGMEKMKRRNESKAKTIYQVIDDDKDFYICPVDKQCRSLMNVRFRIQNGNAQLEKKFIEEAAAFTMHNRLRIVRNWLNLCVILGNEINDKNA